MVNTLAKRIERLEKENRELKDLLAQATRKVKYNYNKKR